MGIYASYVLIDDATLERLAEEQLQVSDCGGNATGLEDAAFEDMVADISENAAVEMSLEKNWDIMHYLLTGQDTSEPQEGNPLSEAIVGELALDTEYYCAITDNERIRTIAAALNEFDFSAALNAFTVEAGRQAELYPNIWEDDDEWDELCEDLADCYALLRRFYSQAAENHGNLLVTIQ